MDLNVVEKEVATWAPEAQDRLAAYLTILRLERSSDHAQELDRQPARERGFPRAADSDDCDAHGEGYCIEVHSNLCPTKPSRSSGKP